MIGASPGLRFKALWLVACSALIAAPEANAQRVPETIHSDAKAHSTLCGVTGADALAVMQIVRKMPGLKDRRISSARFELFSSPDEMVQWVFTRPNEPAYPAVTCREMRKDADGNIWMQRDMRCDADREACDKLFLEFQDLDRQLKSALGKPKSG